MPETAAPFGDGPLAPICRPDAGTETFIEEAFKLGAEDAKLRAEDRELGRDARLVPVTTPIPAMSASGALAISIVTLVRTHG